MNPYLEFACFAAVEVGREALENCPAHVDAADMRPEDVSAVCEDECQKARQSAMSFGFRPW